MTLLLLPSALRAGDATAGVAAPLADVLRPPSTSSGVSPSAGCIILSADALLLSSIYCADRASAISTAASTPSPAANPTAAQSSAPDCTARVASCALQGRMVKLIKKRYSVLDQDWSVYSCGVTPDRWKVKTPLSISENGLPCCLYTMWASCRGKVAGLSCES